METPCGEVPYCSTLAFTGGMHAPIAPLAIFRVMDATGRPLPGASMPHPVDQAMAVRMYHTMVTLQVTDALFYEAQRQVGV